MSTEQEILDFTNWLNENNWKLIGNGMCLHLESKQIGFITDLLVESKKI